jgi:hypothetical protein
MMTRDPIHLEIDLLENIRTSESLELGGKQRNEKT